MRKKTGKIGRDDVISPAEKMEMWEQNQDIETERVLARKPATENQSSDGSLRGRGM